MSDQSTASDPPIQSQATQGNVESNVAFPQEVNRLAEVPTSQPFEHSNHEVAILGTGNALAESIQKRVLEIADQASRSSGNVVLFAPQFKVYQPNHYNISGSTLQIADKIDNRNVTENGNRTSVNFKEVKVTPSTASTLSRKENCGYLEISTQLEQDSDNKELSFACSKGGSSQTEEKNFKTDSKSSEKLIYSSVCSKCGSSSCNKNECQRRNSDDTDNKMNKKLKRKKVRRSSASSAFARVRHFLRYGAISSKVLKMKTMLDERAAEESGKMSYPVKANLAISRVPLQLSTQVERSLKGMDNHGHYNKRCDFKSVMKKAESDVSLRDIFKRAKTRAKENSKKETTEASRKRFVQRHGNIVGMIGQAGIGKTTLCRMLLQSIIEGEMLPKTQFIFYIPFREVDFINETSLMKFALTGCRGWEYIEDSDKELLNIIETNENVVFIFDGLDEANTDRLSGSSHHCDLYSKKKPDMFLAKILTGDLFPNANKLITSRPRQLFKLHPDYRPHFVVDILGLNEEAQVELCKQICRESFDLVIHYLKSNPDIFSCCYVPVNCIITMSIIQEILKADGKINLISLTDIFVRALEAFVESDHVRNYRDQVWKLSKLAWDGFLEKKIVFGEADFTNAKIDEAVFQAFLCTYLKGEIRGTILQGKKKSSFSHLTWQEFFAAIYLAMFLPLNEFHDIVKSKSLSDPLWEVVSKFLFGLCNFEVMDRLENIMYPQTSNDWERKKDDLFSSINISLQTGVSSDAEQFRLFSWIREADNNDLNTLIANHIPQHFVFSSSLLLTDAVSAAYMLKRSTKPLNIRTEKGLASTILEYICDQFATFLIKITSLDVSYNEVGDKGARAIAKCLHNVDDLNLFNCSITSVGVREIANKLRTCKIRSLNISFNNISDVGVRAIAKCLNNVDDLSLCSCRITSVGTKVIANQLQKCKINSLNLSRNNIGDEGAKAIAKALNNIKNLNLFKCSITSVGAKEIAQQLKECKIKSLIISGNTISDHGARAIAKYRKNVDSLKLGNCHLTSDDAKEIAYGLEECKAASDRVD